MTISYEGPGATVVFATSGVTYEVYSISLGDRAREAIDITHLGSNNKVSKPGKLIDPGEISLVVDFDPAIDRLIGAAPETVTITLPLITAGNTAATVAFTGYCTSEGGEELAVDGSARTSVTIKATTVPVFTPEATP